MRAFEPDFNIDRVITHLPRLCDRSSRYVPWPSAQP